MIWAILPAKLSRTSKARLAPVLPPDLRERLAAAMLTDVLGAVQRCPRVTGTLVVSRDEPALEIARRGGAEPLRERTGAGLNAAVAEALQAAVRRGADAVLIVMGDLPLLRAEELDRVLCDLPARGVVLVPSADGTGTNVVAARPPTIFEPEFGPASLERHRAQCRRTGVDAVVLPSPGAAVDVDTPDDLESLRSSVDPATASGALLSAVARPPGIISSTAPSVDHNT